MQFVLEPSLLSPSPVFPQSLHTTWGPSVSVVEVNYLSFRAPVSEISRDVPFHVPPTQTLFSCMHLMG